MEGSYKELWLVRHGETDWLHMGLVQGYADVGLNTLGRLQMERLGLRLRRAGVPFDGLWSSDLRRARESAVILQSFLPVPPRLQLSPLLREVNPGKFTGLAEEEILQRYPESLREILQDPWEGKRPQGESLADVAQRATAFLESLPPGRHLVVTHEGWLKALLAGPVGLGRGSLFRVLLLPSSLTRILLPEKLLVTLGDVAHLEGQSPFRPIGSGGMWEAG